MAVNEPLNLYNYIVSFHMITCNKCGKEGNTTLDDAFEAADIFYEDGWRTINDDVYCKTCYKKKTKKK